MDWLTRGLEILGSIISVRSNDREVLYGTRKALSHCKALGFAGYSHGVCANIFRECLTILSGLRFLDTGADGLSEQGVLILQERKRLFRAV